MNRGAQAALSQAASVDAMLGDDGVPGFARADRCRVGERRAVRRAHLGRREPVDDGDIAFATGTDQWHWKAEKAIRAEQESWLLTQEVLRAYRRAQRRSRGRIHLGDQHGGPRSRRDRVGVPAGEPRAHHGSPFAWSTRPRAPNWRSPSATRPTPCTATAGTLPRHPRRLGAGLRVPSSGCGDRGCERPGRDTGRHDRLRARGRAVLAPRQRGAAGDGRSAHRGDRIHPGTRVRAPNS